MTRKAHRTFSDQFKNQRVRLFKSGEWYYKVSRTDHGTKVNVDRNNAHKYSVEFPHNLKFIFHHTKHR